MIFSPPLCFPHLPLHLFNLIFISSIPLSYPYLINMLLSKLSHVLLGLKKTFITPEILSQKSKRSKLETIFRKSRNTESRNNFKSQAKLVANLISSSTRTYYKDLILQTSKQPKKLWSTLQSLLSLKTPTILPTSISTSCLAQSFLDFFKDKIARLSSSLTPNSTSSPHLPPSSSPPPFNTFSPACHD